MKRILLLLITLAWAPLINAEAAQEPNLTQEQCYQAFSKFTPQSVIASAKKAARYLSTAGAAGLERYNSINEESWPGYPLAPLITVMNCDEDRAMSFPLDEMRATVTTPGFLKKFVDANKQHTFVKACAQLKGAKRGVWVLQDHFWLKCDGVLRMGVLFYKVPGTKWTIQTSLPNQNYSLEELNQLLKQ